MLSFSELFVSFPPTGFKLKHFLRDNETLSNFLQRNASLSRHAALQIAEADVDLEQVSRHRRRPV